MKRYGVFISLFALFILASHADEWTLAASPLLSSSKNESATSLCVSIPEMIVKQLKTDIFREVSENEEYKRRLSLLLSKRMDLLLRLRQTVRERDSAVLSLHGVSMKSKISECERKIAEIKKEILKNLQKQQEAEKENATSKEGVSTGEGKTVKKKKKESKERVVLYNSGGSCIFTPSALAQKEGGGSFVMMKETESAGIEGLLVGEMDDLSGFITVSVKVYSYPAAVVLAEASDIADIKGASALASRLASALLPHVLSSFPARITFKSAQEKTSLKMDGTFYEKFPKTMEVSSGVHLLEFTAPDFTGASTAYNFEGNGEYDIFVKLKPLEKRFAFIKSDNFFTSEMFASSRFEHENESDSAKISLNGESVTGLFLAEDGKRLWYFLDGKKLKDGETYAINKDVVDMKSILKIRRHSMYFAYSLFITSLIPTFYCTGNYASALVAKEESRGIGEKELATWSALNYTFAGVSAASAIYFVVELVRYLKAADKVLPVSEFSEMK